MFKLSSFLGYTGNACSIKLLIIKEPIVCSAKKKTMFLPVTILEDLRHDLCSSYIDNTPLLVPTDLCEATHGTHFIKLT